MTVQARWRPVRAAAWLVGGWLAVLPAVGQAQGSGQDPATVRRVVHSVLMVGARVGEQVTEATADGQVRVRYAYRENGRGPELAEDFTVAADQQPRAYRVTGKATFGADIAESFTLDQGRLRWQSVVDRGDEPAAAGVVYVPLDHSPAYGAQMLQAVLARGTAGAVSPNGARLSAERLAVLPVNSPAGPPFDVGLYALTGLDTTPWLMWLREDATRGFFAAVGSGWQVVEQGFEAAGDRLHERQRQAQDERLRSLQQRLAQPLPGLTLIRAVRWFDAPAARLRPAADVYLQDGRVTAITAPGALPAARPDQVVDGRGRTLLPGLIDMHAHIGPDDALMHLAAGVTTVRDMANDNADLQRLKARIDAGEQAGPHIVAAGAIEGASPHAMRSAIVSQTLDEALAAVDWYAARGYRQVKLYNSIKPEWVKPLTARAHQRGLTVAGHVPAFMRAEQAVRAGYDELTHINQLMLNFFVGPRDDTRTLLRFTLVGDKAAAVALQSPEVRRFVALLRQHRTAVDPTLATFEAMYTQRHGEPHPSLGDVASHLPAVWQRGLRNSEMNPTPEQVKRYRVSYQRMVQLVGHLHRAGVPLVAGTDGPAGLLLHRELALLVQAGITPPEALRIGTWNGARIAGVATTSGRIVVGGQADLLLVDGDPTRHIGDLRRGSLVIKGRQAYAPAALYQALGIKPFVDAATVERAAPPPHASLATTTREQLP